MIFIVLETTASPGSMISAYSNAISDSIIALLKCDLRRVVFIKEKLFGQQLPLGLRQLLWTEYLFRSEKKSFNYDPVSAVRKWQGEDGSLCFRRVMEKVQSDKILLLVSFEEKIN